MPFRDLNEAQILTLAITAELASMRLQDVSGPSGKESNEWNVGLRVGVAWFGGDCGYCESCRRGDFLNCSNLIVSGCTREIQRMTVVLEPTVFRAPWLERNPLEPTTNALFALEELDKNA